MGNIFQYKYQACPRCKCETILNDINTSTGERIFQCLDCGYYKSKSKEITNPYGVVQYLRLSDWRKVVQTIESEEEYNTIVTPMITDDDVILLSWSNLCLGIINKQRFK